MEHHPPAEFGQMIKRRREHSGLSLSEVARRAGIDKSSLSLLERGLSRPKPETIRALADVLGASASDLFDAADYLRANELPSLRPYMRAKYHDLPDEAVAEVEAFIGRLQKRHTVRQPVNDEDEH